MGKRRTNYHQTRTVFAGFRMRAWEVTEKDEARVKRNTIREMLNQKSTGGKV